MQIKPWKRSAQAFEASRWHFSFKNGNTYNHIIMSTLYILYIYIYIYTIIMICVYVAYVFIYIYIYIHIYIHTHTHIYIYMYTYMLCIIYYMLEVIYYGIYRECHTANNALRSALW